MSTELNEELNEGETIARQLVDHMQRMGASALEIPVELAEEGPMDGTKLFVIVDSESRFEEWRRYRKALERIRDERSDMSDDSIESHRTSDNSGDHQTAAFALESRYYADIAAEALKPPTP